LGYTKAVPSKIALLKFLDNCLGRLLVELLSAPRSRVVERPASVLFIRPGGIGDALLFAPGVAALHHNFPEAAIDVLAEQRNAGAFALMPGLHEILIYDSPATLIRLLRRRYDVVIDTEQWHRLSAVICRLIRSEMKIGFATNERYCMFTHPVPYAQDCFEAESFLRLLGPLGITDEGLPTGEILRVSDGARRKAVSMLSAVSQQPVVALFPSASIPEKRWELKKFRELTGWCSNHGLQVVILGGRHDRVLGEQIVVGQKGLNLVGLTSLAESAAVLERAAVVVSGDSGILHLASLLGRPTVSLFGPSNAAKWAPSGPDHIVLNKNLPCSPCARFGNMPKCPVGVRCLQEITAEEVMVAVMTLLHRNAGRKTTDVPVKDELDISIGRP
jgi:lipopolysaccharide heptosyltransferase II